VQLLHPAHHALRVEPPERRHEVADVEHPAHLHHLEHDLLELPRALVAGAGGSEHPPPDGRPRQRVRRTDVHGLAERHRRVAVAGRLLRERPHHERGLTLPDVADVVESARGEEVHGAHLAHGAPPGPVGGEHDVLVVVRHELAAGVWRATAEVGVVDAEELLRHGRRTGHHHVGAAEPQPQQRAVHLGQLVQRLVRLPAQLRQVAQHGPAPRPRRQRRSPRRRLLLLPEEDIADGHGHCYRQGGEQQRGWEVRCSEHELHDHDGIDRLTTCALRAGREIKARGMAVGMCSVVEKNSDW